MKRPNVVYCAMVNLSGLGVFTATWQPERKCWYDRTGDLDVTHLGTHKPYDQLTTFASANKKERDLWVQGARTVLRALHTWCTE